MVARIGGWCTGRPDHGVCDHRRAMTRTDPPQRAFDTRYGYLIACLPFVVLGILAVLAPSFLDQIDANPPALFGLPAGMVLLGLGIAWGALAFVVIWAASSRVGVLVAQLFFTMPSMFLIILAGPVVQILEHFGQI
jgi:hypothetical protein